MGGGTQRLAAVAAVSHARQYYNRTQSDVDSQSYDPIHFNVNVFFASATLCGVVLAVCMACWRRAAESKYVHDTAATHHPDVYTISAEIAQSIQEESLGAIAGPPPAYDAVVDKPPDPNKSEDALESVVSESCPRCHGATTPVHPGARPDAGLPSYEAAVLLRDTKL